MGAITIQFVQGGGFGGRLIRWFDHGEYSHVDTVLPDGTLLGARDDVVGSVPAGVQIRPASYVENEAVLRVTIPTTDDISAEYYEFIKSQIGKPYDEIAILAFALESQWSSTGSWFCSMLVAAALQAADWCHPLSVPPTKIAPDDLLLVISAAVDIGINRLATLNV